MLTCSFIPCIVVSLNYLLQGSLGFGWSIRVTAFICLALLLLGNLLLFDPKPGCDASAALSDDVDKPRTSDEPVGDSDNNEKVDAQAEVEEGGNSNRRVPLFDRRYVRVLIQGFLTGLGLWFPSSYVQLFAEKKGVNQQLTFFSLAILNVANALGRILPNWLSDRWGAVEVYVPCLVLNCTLHIHLLCIA